jgi:mycothiol synthase
MILPDGYEDRTATPSDVDLVLGLYHDVERHRFGTPEASRHWIEQAWNSGWVDLPSMTRLVTAADGSVAGYGELESPEPAVAVDAFVCVHPDHLGRGIGAWLADWSETATAGLARAGSHVPLRNSVTEVDASGSRLLRDRGYGVVRTFWHMRMDLPAEFDAGSVPVGVHIRSSRPEDEVGIWETMTDAFRGHFGYLERPLDAWWRDMRAGGYRPDLMLVASMDGGDVVGASYQQESEGVGWVADLAVRRSHQRRGIGRALLRHALADLARRGFGVVQLNVDARNESGASGLYESVGMRRHRTWNVWEKTIQGAG